MGRSTRKARTVPARKKSTHGARKKKTTRRRIVAKAKRRSQRSVPMARRADYGANVDDLVGKLAEPTRTMVESLRHIVREAAPAAEESIKWGMAVYALDGLLCYIQPYPNYVRFGFYQQGIRLGDPERRLEGTGEAMRHVKIEGTGDIRPTLFRDWVRQAAAINRAR